ncbi:hypothetical protein GCM10028807_50100 [Spirosoma daeguense]
MKEKLEILQTWLDREIESCKNADETENKDGEDNWYQGAEFAYADVFNQIAGILNGNEYTDEFGFEQVEQV